MSGDDLASSPITASQEGLASADGAVALLAETGEDRFSAVLARVGGDEDRLERSIDMVEEKAVREDLTFAEMAQVAIIAARDVGAGRLPQLRQLQR